MTREMRSGSNEASAHSDQSREYAVILPCDAEYFGEFVSGLLGKPQTIERFVEGAFQISQSDVSNAFHMVDQRIHQQNEATLVQFNVRINYDDDSSVLLAGLESFNHYNEVRPLKSVGVTLSWVYLVKFRNKKVPEKQEIDISFIANHNTPRLLMHPGFREVFAYGDAGIFLRIRHTERTWGVDLESLLTGFARSVLFRTNRAKRFIWYNSGLIGLSVGISVFLGAIYGSYLTFTSFGASYSTTMAKLRDATTGGVNPLNRRMDFLIDLISSGAWSRLSFAIDGFLVTSLVAATVLGVWVAFQAGKPPRSFVLLTKQAEEAHKETLRRIQRDWLLFALSILVSIAAGVVSNIIFSSYFSKMTW